MVGREKDGSLAAAEKLVREKGLERNVKIVPGFPRARSRNNWRRGHLSQYRQRG